MKKLSVSAIKIMIWKADIEIYVSKDMLETKTSLGEQSGNKIVLSPNIVSLKELLDTACHEILHYVLPELDEDEIRKLTKKVMQSLTKTEKLHLFLKIGEHLKKVEI